MNFWERENKRLIAESQYKSELTVCAKYLTPQALYHLAGTLAGDLRGENVESIMGLIRARDFLRPEHLRRLEGVCRIRE